MYTKYEPTQKDLDVLAFAQVRKEIENDPYYKLICSIQCFDYYYDYSDDGSVWRSARAQEKEINKQIDEIEDVDLRQFLRSCFSVKGYVRLKERFPWVEQRWETTELSRIMYAGTVDIERACELLGIKNAIEELKRDFNKAIGVHSASYTDSILCPYARNIPAATKRLREGLSYRGHWTVRPITVPDAMLERLKWLSEIVHEGNYFTDLNKLANCFIGVEMIGGLILSELVIYSFSDFVIIIN